MKKTFTYLKASTLLLLLVLSSVIVQAKPIGCVMTLNNFIRPFSYLTTGTRVTDIESTCGTKTGIPLGFTFKFGGCETATAANYTSLQVSSAGWVKFGTAVTGCKPNPISKDIFPGMWIFYGNTVIGDGGTATYLTETLPSGTKVFTMEWKNWKLKTNTTATDYYVISFQLKLYEGSNLVEYCYKLESGSTGPTPVSFAVPYQIGMGILKPPTTPPYPADACDGPGYDFFQMDPIITTPLINRGGLFGPNIFELPNDNQVLQFYQPCCGKPEAGFISQPDSVCPCAPFVVRLSGATPYPFLNFGIKYKWQTAASATGPWTDVASAAPDAKSLYFPGICGSADTFIRVIVVCDSSKKEDTTPVKRIILITDPNNCYCYSVAQNDDILNRVNIGNVKVITKGKDTLIDNVKGAGTPGLLNKQPFRSYSLYTGIPTAELNRDSTYNFQVMGLARDTFAFPSSGVALYIDFNKDGLYAASSELAAFSVISGTSTSFLTTFNVPSAAVLAKTGMRVVMKRGATISSDVPPCGAYDEGETEDYLVNIVNPRCNGPLSAGKAFIADTSICDGYTTTVGDTTHALNMSGMNWEWEYSLDNVIWATVPSTQFVDIIKPVVRQSTYYRLRMICEYSKDTIYSNKVYIKLKQPYKCYCYSLANGGDMDSSDITTVTLGKFTLNTGGPHVFNPESIRMRTDNTHLPAIELTALDNYPIAVYHTLKTRNHADARISVFMDFNHNLVYDGASELVWTTTSTLADYFPHSNITIPNKVIPDVETGMRVVLNNDLGASNPNDIGCEEFTSGEIEDYLVIFRRKSTSIGDITNVDNLQIYPNPNNGQFTISFSARQSIAEAKVVVTNMTGQEVFTENYNNINSSFVKNINLIGQAPGVYFISVIADGQKSVNKLIVR